MLEGQKQLRALKPPPLAWVCIESAEGTFRFRDTPKDPSKTFQKAYEEMLEEMRTLQEQVRVAMASARQMTLQEKTDAQKGLRTIARFHLFDVTKDTVCERYIPELPFTTKPSPKISIWGAMYTNPTALPDECYLRSTVILLIRNPCSSIPSFVSAWRRTGIDLGSEPELFWHVCRRWSRELFDWLLELREEDNNVALPIVIDTDDFIYEPSILQAFCKETGLNPEELAFEWEGTDKSQHSAMLTSVETGFLSTISSSCGILADNRPYKPHISEEKQKWVQEYGNELAIVVEEMVMKDLPDYEYLSQYRLKA